MLKTLTLLMRGAIADSAQAVDDAHAIAILRQQIRDAAAALAGARRELGVAMAYHAAELRAVRGLESRIATISDAARKALVDGRDDLGHEAAVLIAGLEDERIAQQAEATRFATEVDGLTSQVARAQYRLRDLDRGLQTARATEAVRRATVKSRRVMTTSTSALGEAESTLARLRSRQQDDEDIHEALASLEADAAGSLQHRLATAGYDRPRTDPKDVFERLKALA
ncbi:PspA/IM30 family protein [Lichenifustis flavocetrariae]|uniref:PspA/IM30 family protein n=1 Tax=Lichenifustis flavocetrariae TaxID=2949735 RepID=A0AA42CI59_9HYPH|nr:PspA/IM30 family protein [Lichenifustis flavocetrariae]MCW6508014.1 PspA/IM30 family protein [Lichenifustis flavocetrariae]